MKHRLFEEVKTLVQSNIPVLLESEAGTGKTTVCMSLAAELDLKFYSNSLTKQTSVGNLVGFIDIHGNYSPTQLRTAFEQGGLYLLDELDAGDANTLLILNTIENGYIAFPDKVVERHKDFRLVATCNPMQEHSIYTGRSKLDQSTLDRFVIVQFLRDQKLEEKLISSQVKQQVDIVRSLLVERRITKTVTMRSAILYKSLLDLNVEDPMTKTLLRGVDECEEIIESFNKQKPKPKIASFDDLFEVANGRDL